MSDTQALQLAVRAIEGFRIKNADLERQLAEAQGVRDGALALLGEARPALSGHWGRLDVRIGTFLDRILRGTKEGE